MSGEGVTTPSPLDAARLIVRGVNVIPLLPRDKRPATAWERLARRSMIGAFSADALDGFVDSWWRGTGNNLGAITGKVSDLVVVDADGEEALALVRAVCGGEPATLGVLTAKGKHYWFRHPGGERPNRANVGGARLDVRADGGYVVCPPSVHPSGSIYRWDPEPDWTAGRLPLTEMPHALVDLIWPRPKPRVAIRRPPRRDAGRYVEAALSRELERVASAREGERNVTLNEACFRLARFLATGQLDERELTDAMLDAARRAGLPEREAAGTIASAIRGRRAS